MHLIERLRARPRNEAGFTLVELVLTVAIVGIITVALVGVVLEYLKTTTATAGRFTQSNTAQLAAAYWQRDVASIGLRSNTYDSATHSFALQASVDYPYSASLIGAGCSVPGTGVVTLSWGQYDSTSSDSPTKVAITYSVQPVGSGSALRYDLRRTRCTNSGAGWSTASSAVITQNLSVTPTVTCSSTCGGAGNNLPSTVSLRVTSSDPNNDDGSTYVATLTGERRQT
ncbi:MAG: PulJ/GspJ family protein [Marmoricola sp.]